MTSSATLTPSETATRLGIGVEHLRRLIRAGTITPSSRSPGGHARFDASDVEAIRQSRVAQKGGTP